MLRRALLWTLLVNALLLTAAVGVGRILSRAELELGVMDSAIARGDWVFQRVDTRTGLVRPLNVPPADSLTWGPDGTHYVQVHRGTEASTVWVGREGAPPTAIEVYGLGWTARTPAWSADGTRLALVAESRGWQLTVRGADGALHSTLNIASGGARALAWAEGDTRLHVFTADGVQRVDPATGANLGHLRLAAPPLFDPRWSPDGARVAFQRRNDGQGDYCLALFTVATAQEVPVLCAPYPSMQVAWSPDGARLAVVSGTIGARTLQLITPATGERTLLTIIDGPSIPAWSADGTWLAYTNRYHIVARHLPTGATRDLGAWFYQQVVCCVTWRP